MQSLPSLSSDSQSSSSSSTDSSYRGRRIKKDVLLKRWPKIKPFRQDSETLHIVDILRKLDKLKEAVENVRMDLDPDSGQPSCIQCRAETPSEFSLLSDIMSGNLLERASEIEQKLMEISSGAMNKHIREDMHAVEKLEREICRIYPGFERTVHVARRIDCNQQVRGEREASTQEQKIILDIETQNQDEQPQNMQFVVNKTADQNVYHRRKKNQYRQVVTTTEKIMRTDQQYVQMYDTILEDDGRGPFDRKILTQRSKTRFETIQGMDPTKEVLERRRTTRFIDNKTKEVVELISDLGNQSETPNDRKHYVSAPPTSTLNSQTKGSTISVASNANWIFRQPIEHEAPQGDFKSRWNLVKSRAYMNKSDDSIFTESLLTDSSSSVERLQSGTSVSQMKHLPQEASGDKSVDVVYRKRSFDDDGLSDAFSRQQSFWVNTISYLSNKSQPDSRVSSKHNVDHKPQPSASAFIEPLKSQIKSTTTDKEPSWHSLSSCSASTSEYSRDFPSSYHVVYRSTNSKHSDSGLPDRKSTFGENLSSKQKSKHETGRNENMDEPAGFTQNKGEVYFPQSQQASVRQSNGQNMYTEGPPTTSYNQYIENLDNFTSSLPPLRHAEHAIVSNEMSFQTPPMLQPNQEDAKSAFESNEVYFIQQPMSTLRQFSGFDSKWTKEPAIPLERSGSGSMRNKYQSNQQSPQINRQKSQISTQLENRNSQAVNIFLETTFPEDNGFELSHGHITDMVRSKLKRKHSPNGDNGKSSHEDTVHLSSVSMKAKKSRSTKEIVSEQGIQISDAVSFAPSLTTLANPAPDFEPLLPVKRQHKRKSKRNYIDTLSDESNRSEDEEFVGQMFLSSRPFCESTPENLPQKLTLSRMTKGNFQNSIECVDGSVHIDHDRNSGLRIFDKRTLEVPQYSRENKETITHSCKAEVSKHFKEPRFVRHSTHNENWKNGHHSGEVTSVLHNRGEDRQSFTASYHRDFIQTFPESLDDSQTSKLSKQTNNEVKIARIDLGSGELIRYSASHFPENIQSGRSKQSSAINLRSQAGQVSDEHYKTQARLPSVFVMMPSNTNISAMTWQPDDLISSFQSSQYSNLPQSNLSHQTSTPLGVESMNMSAGKYISTEVQAEATTAPSIYSSIFASESSGTSEPSVIKIEKSDTPSSTFGPTGVIYNKSSSPQEQTLPYNYAGKSEPDFDNIEHPSALWVSFKDKYALLHHLDPTYNTVVFIVQHANTNQTTPVKSNIPRTASMLQRPEIHTQSSRMVSSAHPSEHSGRPVVSKSRIYNASRPSLNNIQHHHPSMRSIPMSRQSVPQQSFLRSLIGVPNAQSRNQVGPHRSSGYSMKVSESQGTIRSTPQPTISTLQHLQRSMSHIDIHMPPEPPKGSTNSVGASQASVRNFDSAGIPRTHSAANLGELSTKQDIIQSLLTVQGQKSDESLIDHSGSEVLMVLNLDHDKTPGSKANKEPMAEPVVKTEDTRGKAGESQMRLSKENKEIHVNNDLSPEHTGHSHSHRPIRKKKPSIKTRVEIHFPTDPTGNTPQVVEAKEPEKKVGMADKAVSFAHFPEIRSYVVDSDKPLRKFRSKPNVTPQQDSSSNVTISSTQGSRSSLQQPSRSNAGSNEQNRMPERQKSGENVQPQKPQCLSNKLAPYFEVLLQDNEEKLEESRLRCLENLAKKKGNERVQPVAMAMASKSSVAPQQSKASTSKPPPDKPVSVSNYNLENMFQPDRSKIIERKSEVVNEKSKVIVPEIVVVKPPSNDNVSIVSKRTQETRSITATTDKNNLPVQPEKSAPSQSSLKLNALFADTSKITTHSKVQSVKSDKDVSVQREQVLQTKSNPQPHVAQKQSEMQPVSVMPAQQQELVAQPFMQMQGPNTEQVSQINAKQSVKAIPEIFEPEPSMVKSPTSLSASQSGSTLSEQDPEQIELVHDSANQQTPPHLATTDENAVPIKQQSTILEKVLSLIHPLTNATEAIIVQPQSNLQAASNAFVNESATIEPAKSHSRNQLAVPTTSMSAINKVGNQSKLGLTSTTALKEPSQILEPVKSQALSVQKAPSIATIPRDENLSKLKSVSKILAGGASKVVIPNETMPPSLGGVGMVQVSSGPEPPTQANNTEGRIFIDPVAMIKDNLAEPRLESGQQPEKEQPTRPNLIGKSHVARKREIRRTIRKPPEPPKSFFASKFLSRFLSRRMTSEEELYRERRYLQIAVVDDPEEIPEGDSMLERFRCYSVRSRTLHLTDSEIDVLCTKKAERVKKEARQLRRGRSRADFTF